MLFLLMLYDSSNAPYQGLDIALQKKQVRKYSHKKCWQNSTTKNKNKTLKKSLKIAKKLTCVAIKISCNNQQRILKNHIKKD